jgi:hypothetical protein
VDNVGHSSPATLPRCQCFGELGSGEMCSGPPELMLDKDCPLSCHSRYVQLHVPQMCRWLWHAMFDTVTFYLILPAANSDRCAAMVPHKLAGVIAFTDSASVSQASGG